MKAGFRKDIFIMLIISAVLSIGTCFCLSLEVFLPSPYFSGYYVMYLVIIAYLMFLSITSIYMACRLDKFDPLKTLKILGIVGFSMLIVIFVENLLSSLIFPRNLTNWTYYLILVMVTANIIYYFFMIIYINNRLIVKHPGYAPIRSICWFINLVNLQLLLFFILGLLRVILGLKQDPNEGIEFTPFYFYFILAQIIMSFIILVVEFYFCFAAIVTVKEKELVDVKHNLKFSLKVFRKYHLEFYFSCLGNILALITAIVSLTQYKIHYLTFVILYVCILLIRIPTHYHSVYLNKKYNGDPVSNFKYKHLDYLYTAFILILYTVFMVIFGLKAANADVDKQSVYSLFVIFVPYAVLRSIAAIFKFRRGRKFKDPSLMNQFFITSMLAMFTLTNTFYILNTVYVHEAWKYIAYVFVILTLVYASSLSVYLIIVGIRGLKSKRAEALKSYLNAPKIDEDLERKDILVED